MFAPAHSSSSSYSHPPILTLTSSSLTTLSRPTSLSTLPISKTLCPDLTKWGLWPYGQHLLRLWAQRGGHTSDDFEVTASFFQGSNVETVNDLGDNDAESPDAEIDDEHIRNALALPLCTQEREVEASLRQIYHSHEGGLFQGAQSNLASTRQPVVWLTQKRKSCQELVDGQIRIIFWIDKKGKITRRSNIRSPGTWVQGGSCRK